MRSSQLLPLSESPLSLSYGANQPKIRCALLSELKIEVTTSSSPLPTPPLSPLTTAFLDADTFRRPTSFSPSAGLSPSTGRCRPNNSPPPGSQRQIALRSSRVTPADLWVGKF